MGLPGASRIPDSLGFTLLGFTTLGFALLVLPACLARRLVRGRFAPASLSSIRVVRLPRSRSRFAFRLRARPSACRSLPGFRLFVNSRFSFAPCTLKTAQVFESRGSPPCVRLPPRDQRFGSLSRLACFHAFRTISPAAGRLSPLLGFRFASALLASRLHHFFLLRSSPRPISIIKLHTLPHFHR